MLDFLEIIKEKGAGDLLFDADIETWNEVLNEKPKITRDDESTDYFWSKSGISYFDYNDGTKEMTVIVKKQKNYPIKELEFLKIIILMYIEQCVNSMVNQCINLDTPICLT